MESQSQDGSQSDGVEERCSGEIGGFGRSEEVGGEGGGGWRVDAFACVYEGGGGSESY